MVFLDVLKTVSIVYVLCIIFKNSSLHLIAPQQDSSFFLPWAKHMRGFFSEGMLTAKPYLYHNYCLMDQIKAPLKV